MRMCVYVCMFMFIDLIDRIRLSLYVRVVTDLWVCMLLISDVCKCVGVYVCRLACVSAGMIVWMCVYARMFVCLHACVRS